VLTAPPRSDRMTEVNALSISCVFVCPRYTVDSTSQLDPVYNQLEKDVRKQMDFERRRFGGPRTMHKAVCSDCGKECEVPFKPTEGKPVYCRECYQKHRRY